MTPKNHDSYNRERLARVLLLQFELLVKHPTASDAKLWGLSRPSNQNSANPLPMPGMVMASETTVMVGVFSW